MPRRNDSPKLRGQYRYTREDERQRRRKRLAQHAAHPNRSVNTATYRKDA
jgi:hypothetical protein